MGVLVLPHLTLFPDSVVHVIGQHSCPYFDVVVAFPKDKLLAKDEFIVAIEYVVILVIEVVLAVEDLVDGVGSLDSEGGEREEEDQNGLYDVIMVVLDDRVVVAFVLQQVIHSLAGELVDHVLLGLLLGIEHLPQKGV